MEMIMGGIKDLQRAAALSLSLSLLSVSGSLSASSALTHNEMIANLIITMKN